METKLNLASGTRCLADWVNIDNSLNARLAKHSTLFHLLYKIKIVPKEFYEWKDVIRSITTRDIRKGLPFDDESIDFIYSSHFIEHLSKEECNSVLNECYRVLKKGGLIRLVTPDLEQLAIRYVQKVQQERNEKASEEFLCILFNLGETSEVPFHIRYLRERFYAKHKYAYDAYSLAHLLKIRGFVNIQKQPYKVGRMPDIQFLDWKPDESLYIEAEKPRQR
jgi:predicted SAM-dependent methyltransferase